MASHTLKQLDLQNMQNTKTLIIVHYKGRRLSIPLTQSCFNLTKFLNTQIHNFQQNVLQPKNLKYPKIKHNNKSAQQHNLSQIVCYKQKIQQNQKYSILGDLKINIILNFIRDFTTIMKDIPTTHHQQFIKEMQNYYSFPQFDITQYYKCIEIQPYFGRNITLMQKKPQFGFHQNYNYKIQSVLSRKKHKNVYLARRQIDGLYTVIKIVKDKKYLNERNQYFDRFSENNNQNPIFPGLIISYENFVIQSSYLQNSFFVSACQYCAGGSLLQYWNNYNNCQPLSQKDCFYFLKQLCTSVYLMHTKKGLMHRQIVLQKIFIGFDKKLRINGQNQMAIPILFNTKRQPKSVNYFQSQIPRTEIYSIGNQTPPQVKNQNKVKYNSLVDYYNIGLVILQLLTGQKYFEGSQSSSRISEQSSEQKNASLKDVLKRLLSQDLEIRRKIVCQILIGVTQSLEEQRQQQKNQQAINHQTIFYGERLDLTENQNKKLYQSQKRTSEEIMDRQFSFLLDKKQQDSNPYLNPMNKPKNKKSRTKSQDKLKAKSKTKSHLEKTVSSNITQIHKIKKIKSPDDKMSQASLDRSKHSRKSKKSKSHQKLTGNSIEKQKLKQISSFKPIETIKKTIVSKQKNKDKSISKQKISQNIMGKTQNVRQKVSPSKNHLTTNVNQNNLIHRINGVENSPKNKIINQQKRAALQGNIVRGNRMRQEYNQRKQDLVQYEYKHYYQRNY